MRVTDAIVRIWRVRDESDRLVANGFCYNPEQLHAKLDALHEEELDLQNLLARHLYSLPTRKQYDTLLQTITDFLS